MYGFLSIFLVPPLPCSLFWEDVVLSPFKKDCVLPSYLHSLLFLPQIPDNRVSRWVLAAHRTGKEEARRLRLRVRGREWGR